MFDGHASINDYFSRMLKHLQDFPKQEDNELLNLSQNKSMIFMKTL